MDRRPGIGAQVSALYDALGSAALPQMESAAHETRRKSPLSRCTLSENDPQRIEVWSV
jgi:hypothetical protein